MSKLNVCPCTIKHVKKNLMAYYLKAINDGVDLQKLDAIFLWSSPGIGKSQLTQQLSHIIGAKTGRKVRVIEIRLSECSIFELIGLMHRDAETKTIVYDAPPIYSVDDEDTITLYLFDELDKATKQLQAAALHLVLDKKFWQYELPKNSIVLAAGNPENIDGELFSKFAPELNNRFRHYLLEPDFPAWKEWALEHEVNPLVVKFLESNQQLLYAEDAGMEQTVFNTPRTWAKVSDYLNLMYGEEEIDWEMAYLDIVGYIGVALALQFKTFCTTKGLMPEIEDIVNGRCRKIPAKADIKDAVSKSLVNYLYTHRETMTPVQWSFVREYMECFPEDYIVVFYRNIAKYGIQKHMLNAMAPQERNSWKKRFGSSVSLGLGLEAVCG